MMWIVRLALRRPYTFAVFALLILILGAYSIASMPTDIFPNIDIPVVTVVWSYTGLSAQEMSTRIIFNSERGVTTTVNDVEHIESQSLNGIGVIKIFFQPHVNVASAVAQVTAIAQVQLRSLPPGTTPPFIIQYNASSVPVLMLGLSGPGLSEQQLNDLATNTIRTQLATVEGAQTPYPYGGKQRQIQVDIDPKALQAQGLSPADVVNAVSAQNLIVPSGTMKMDRFEYAIETNSAPSIIDQLNDLPIKSVNGAIVYVRDVAHVRDGYPPQTNIVRVDGKRAIMMAIMKTGSASTLQIIKDVRAIVDSPSVRGQLPPQMQINALSDQGIFVRGAISGVVREALIAACLTAVMILVFLGSWRSTLIIAVSIPLSILCSITMLALLHETINIMTLGGLALAVGILVDDATVEIENINRNLEQGKEIEQAILDGAAQIATPALVSTLAICIVFVPMFLLSGVARYLFVPLAEAVVFAMLASYLLSRTVVPTMAKYLLHEHDDAQTARKAQSRNPFVRFQSGFEAGFTRFRNGYVRLLTLSVDFAGVFLIIFVVFAVGSVALLVPWLGQDFFPAVDAGQFKIHVRARTGTRIEETASLCDHIDSTIREHIPSSEVVTIVDNIGLPYSGLNLSYSTSAPIGPEDADIQVQLSPKHHPTDEYVQELRGVLAREYPGVTFYVLPVDIVTQILNFGLSAPIDIQIVGPNLYGNRAVAEKMLNEVRYVPGATDSRIQQPFDYPNFTVNVDRTRAQAIGFSQRDVAQSLLVALSGSFQTTPSFYLDPRNGVSYNVAVQTPQYRLDSMSALESLPVTQSASASAGGSTSSSAGSSPAPMETNAPGAPQKPVQVLGNLAQFQPGDGTGHRKPLRRAAGAGHLCQRCGHRPGNRDAGDGKDQGQVREAAAARLPHDSARTERDDAGLVHRTAERPGLFDPAGLLADRGEFPVVARSVSDHFGTASGAGGDCVVPFPDGNAVERAGVDRRDYVHGRGHVEFDSRGELRARTAGRVGGRRKTGGAECGVCPVAAGADDGAGHDPGHDADGVGPGRRRRAECATGTSRNRRTPAGHSGDAVFCAGVFLGGAWLA